MINLYIAGSQISLVPNPQIRKYFRKKAVFLIQIRIWFAYFFYLQKYMLEYELPFNTSQNCPKSQKLSLNLNESIVS
jgi:hypothetical protein